MTTKSLLRVLFSQYRNLPRPTWTTFQEKWSKGDEERDSIFLMSFSQKNPLELMKHGGTRVRTLVYVCVCWKTFLEFHTPRHPDSTVESFWKKRRKDPWPHPMTTFPANPKEKGELPIRLEFLSYLYGARHIKLCSWNRSVGTQPARSAGRKRFI